MTITAPADVRASSGITDDRMDDKPVLLAVSYLRVSTREQAERGGTEEGFSIPAQREANQRKADELGARIVREFVDAGESARSADRDGLQDMLAFIAATRVQFCLVHKLDRLARNRADDVKIHEALINAGVTLVSATESIDQTPSGMLVHGIMSSIAEFYSRNLATEVTKGLTQKVAQGGTPMRAPIGYLNVRRTDEAGREIRTVEVDPERAPLIAWAFEQYAGGETSVTGLLRDLTARGLRTVPTPKRPSKPLGKNTLYKLLTNPYYAGVIRYEGGLYPGAHDPIVEPALFDTVQSLLRARTAKMTRHVQHAHHLKGLLHCGTCGSRMLLDFATNPRGVTYAYFVCSGRASKRTACTRRAVPVAVAERLVADSYASITINDRTYRDLAAKVDAAFDKRMAGRDQEIADLMANRARLEAESDKLLAAHFADAIDLPTLKRHQDRIRAGLADVNQKLAEHDEHHTGGRAFLHDSLRLLTDAHRAYARSGDADRRLANQAFYTRLDVTDDEQLRPRLAEPFATIVREAHEHSDDDAKGAEHEHDEPTHVACSRKTLWVDLSVQQLQTLDCGHQQAPGFPQQEIVTDNRIATLEQVFALAREHGANELRWNIEVKVEDPANGPERDALVDATIAEIYTNGWPSNTQLQSFDWAVMDRAAPVAAELTLGALAPASNPGDGGLDPHQVAERGYDVWVPEHKLVTQAKIDQAHDLGLRVVPWTVNDPTDMRRLMDWGVDGIITDYPWQLRQIMAERGLRLPTAYPAPAGPDPR